MGANKTFYMPKANKLALCKSHSTTCGCALRTLRFFEEMNARVGVVQWLDPIYLRFFT